MKKHTFGKLLSIVMVLALSFALAFAFSTIASAAEGNNADLQIEVAHDDTCGKVKVTWTAVDGAAFYDIYCDSVHVAHVDTAFGNLSSYILTGITANDHVFTLIATDASEAVLATYTCEWEETGLAGQSIHAFVSKTILPTCEDKGYTNYICSCGANYVDIHSFVDALGHDYGAWTYSGNGTHSRTCANNTDHSETLACVPNIENPTCTEDKVCTVCSELLAGKTGHDWGDWEYKGNGTHSRVCGNDSSHVQPAACTTNIPNATCTEDKVCNTCHGVVEEKLGHNAGAAATCTAPQTCTRCSTVLTPALGHNPGPAATCTEDQICLRCNSVLNDALGHFFIAATCDDPSYCARCEMVKPGSEPLGHDYGAWTYNGDGTHWRACGNNHSHVETESCVPGARANCTDPEICTVCNGTLSTNVGHVYTETPTHIVAATCNNPGYDVFKCQNCDEERVVQNSEALGHDYYQATNVLATCTEDGHATFICRRCDDSYTDVFPATGHDWVVVVEQAATLFKTGLQHTECNNCHEKTETVEIPRLTKLTDEQMDLVITVAIVVAAIIIIILLIRLLRSNKPYSTSSWFERRRYR